MDSCAWGRQVKCPLLHARAATCDLSPAARPPYMLPRPPPRLTRVPHTYLIAAPCKQAVACRTAAKTRPRLTGKGDDREGSKRDGRSIRRSSKRDGMTA